MKRIRRLIQAWPTPVKPEPLPFTTTVVPVGPPLQSGKDIAQQLLRYKQQLGGKDLGLR